eukprot:365683-Pleurochrysis_carterae.AAC.1
MRQQARRRRGACACVVSACAARRPTESAAAARASGGALRSRAATRRRASREQTREPCRGPQAASKTAVLTREAAGAATQRRLSSSTGAYLRSCFPGPRRSPAAHLCLRCPRLRIGSTSQARLRPGRTCLRRCLHQPHWWQNAPAPSLGLGRGPLEC